MTILSKACAWLAIVVSALASVSLAGFTQFVTEPRALHGDDTLYIVLFASFSLLAAVAVTISARWAPASLLPQIVTAVVVLFPTAAWVLFWSWLSTAFAVDDAPRVPVLSFLWIMASLSFPLVTPIAVIVDLIRIHRAKQRDRRPAVVGVTLVTTALFCVTVLPWLYW